MGLLSRIFSPSTAKHVEGEYRPGPWNLPITGGWLPHDIGSNWNWWQHGYDPIPSGNLAIVEACVSAYAQTIAMCPGDHWRKSPLGGQERVTTSALSRILRKPNAYQTQSDFLLNAVRALYLEGNAYALALRNNRFEIVELHLMNSRQCHAMVAETGDVFYSLGGNEVIERQLGQFSNALAGVPARDVLHIKMHTPRHPLKGESPLCAAYLDLATAGAMSHQSIAFWQNQSRPSGVLSTDQILSKEQVDALREKWNQQSQGLNAGGVPILSAGLKWQGLSVTAEDAQLVEIMKLTEQHIALVFRIPLQILGIGGTPFASTEALMQSWIASGLGFALNHVEEALGRLFDLPGWPNEYCGFDTAALLRSAFKERIDGLARAVQGGIFAPNEARALEGYDAVEFGDDPRVQQQVVPLSFGANLKPPQSTASTESVDEPPDEDADAEPAPRGLRQLVHAKRFNARIAA
jgi:HK97 family phage portal protein